MNIIGENIISKKRKKERIKINSLDDFKDTLKKEGYKVNEFNEEEFKGEIAKTFGVDKSVIEGVYTYITDPRVTYVADNIKDLIDYIEKMILFKNLHHKLCGAISRIKTLIIDRIEYEREPSLQDNVDNIIRAIEKIENHISGIISEEDKVKLEELEKEIDKEYLYAKDIELLKKMIINNQGVEETYDTQSRTKTITIQIPKEINTDYIKVKKGTVQYHEYLSNNIPRIQRLIRNMNKYMKVDEKEKTTFRIDQSGALQDSINIAVAIYNDKEFKAISGSDEVTNYCTTPPPEKAVFKSSKVNKLGKLGIGYDRVFDSEKKIFEEIHKQIENKILKNKGDLILYSKWKPCPSCYYVIHQFLGKHPHIKVQVKYIKKYGE